MEDAMKGAEMVMEPTVPNPLMLDTPRLPRRAIDRDAALVDQLRRQHPDAPEALLNTYGSRVYRLAVRITGSTADAEEVVQDALWAVVRKIETFRGDSAFGSWLYRIVANAAYQKVRAQRRRPEIALDDVLPAFHEDGALPATVDDWSAKVADPGRQADVRRALTAALDALSPADRTAVILRDAEGFSSAEVAEALGLTVANAKSRVHRARLFLRQRLAVAL
jgi:RNA polymerase sigma-70 factor (ECF subfamily)